jgi:hypothetical protein
MFNDDLCLLVFVPPLIPTMKEELTKLTSRRYNGEWTSCTKSIVFNVGRTLVPLLITAALNIKIFHTIQTKAAERNTLCPDLRRESADSKPTSR